MPEEYCNLMVIKDSYATTNGSEKVAEQTAESNRSEGINVTARYSDIDMVVHVNNATYARWMMDEIPVELQQPNSLKKMNINYLGECFLGDKVKVYHTVINKSNLLHEVVDSNGDKLICLMHSIWEEE